MPIVADQARAVGGHHHEGQSGERGDQGGPCSEGVKRAPHRARFMRPGGLGAGMIEPGKDPDIQCRGEERNRGQGGQHKDPQQIRQPERSIVGEGVSHSV